MIVETAYCSNPIDLYWPKCLPFKALSCQVDPLVRGKTRSSYLRSEDKILPLNAVTFDGSKMIASDKQSLQSR